MAENKQTSFISDQDIYEEVIMQRIPDAKSFLWLATSDMKDLHVHRGRRMIPFLQVLSEIVDTGVSIRLLHAKEPGQAFREDFDKYPNLIQGIERILCPRVHFKTVIIDGEFAFLGSANLTGAGIGAKSDSKRNFESGITTTDTAIINSIMDQFDGIWIGRHCVKCRKKEYCAEYNHLLLNE